MSEISEHNFHFSLEASRLLNRIEPLHDSEYRNILDSDLAQISIIREQIQNGNGEKIAESNAVPVPKPLTLRQRVRQAIEEIKYPSKKTIDALVTKALIPSTIVSAGSIIGGEILNIILPSMNPENALFAINSLLSLQKILLVENIALIAYFFDRVIRKERSYGELLTFRKVAMNDEVLLFFPQIANQKSYGELHFVGGSLLLKRIPDKPKDLLLQGIEDLSSLAEACQRNDPRLENLEVFIGISPLVDKYFTKLGFQITPIPDDQDIKNYNIFHKIYMCFNSVMGRLINYHPRNQNPSACMITRETLVENLEFYRKILAKYRKNS
ncbi:hypothetical protein KC726_00530 [Candidatus Woesebacteria bacterium]|nr:hypothetical protein [Candidatus Woesebacteria bacterium]